MHSVPQIERIIRRILADNEPQGIVMGDLGKFFPEGTLWREVWDYLVDQRAVRLDIDSRWHLATLEGRG